MLELVGVSAFVGVLVFMVIVLIGTGAFYDS